MRKRGVDPCCVVAPICCVGFGDVCANAVPARRRPVAANSAAAPRLCMDVNLCRLMGATSGPLRGSSPPRSNSDIFGTYAETAARGQVGAITFLEVAFKTVLEQSVRGELAAT